MRRRKLTRAKKAALVTVLAALLTALRSRIQKTITPAPSDYESYEWTIDTFNDERFRQLFRFTKVEVRLFSLT